MLQDILLTVAAAASAPAGPVNNAEALQQLGFSHMIQNQDFVSRFVLVFLVIMSIGSWWYTIVNLIKNLVIRTRADRVVRTFWETPQCPGRGPLHGRAKVRRAVLQARPRLRPGRRPPPAP